LGKYPSKRSAEAAARTAVLEGRSGPERGTVGWLVRSWVASRTDISQKGREQYEWAVPHIESGLGAIPLDRLDRDDVAGWLEQLAAGGRLSRRGIEICRTVLRDAVEEGRLRRNPGARVPMPRQIAKPPKARVTEAWTEAEVADFLRAAAEHRWAVGFRIAVLKPAPPKHAGTCLQIIENIPGVAMGIRRLSRRRRAGARRATACRRGRRVARRRP
jgi:hypothetical protein